MFTMRLRKTLFAGVIIIICPLYYAGVIYIYIFDFSIVHHSVVHLGIMMLVHGLRVGVPSIIVACSRLSTVGTIENAAG